MSDWAKNKEREINQDYADFKVSYPLAERHQMTPDFDSADAFEYMGDSEADSKIRHYFRSFTSTLLVFVGIYMTYTPASIMSKSLIIGSFSYFGYLLAFFGLGLIMTILGIEKFSDKANFKTYLVVPLFSFFLGFLFMIFPQPMQSQFFGWFHVMLFPLIVFFFYYVKDKVYPVENDLK